ncbi:MAG: 30S ribosomal protein S12 methylthiotransferase RimO [Desulfococcaceae bacterium]
MAATAGRAIHLLALGCARNQVDGEEMTARLRQAHWTPVDDPEAAEVVVVNTCGFIQAAAEESIATILELAELKKTGNLRSLIVAGCLPQRYGRELAREMPEVDVFLGTGAFDQIVAAAENSLSDGPCLLPDPEALPLDSPECDRATGGPSVYIKIAEGCSRSCTYCVIPRLRGRQRSRASAAILKEARRHIDAGARELVLVAQETTAYGRDRSEGEDGAHFAALLTDMADLSSDVWIRFLYGHPESLDDRTLDAMAGRKNICPYFDLPIQHASRPVLKRMGRNHPPEAMLRLFARIRERIPQAALRTTVILGFPGETEADVQALLDFLAEVRFDHLGAFTYSDGEDLSSHRLPDHVSRGEARRRRDRVMALQRGISEEKLGRFLDQTATVLVEEPAEPGIILGRTVFQAPEVDGLVYVHHDGGLSPGDRAQVRITDTLEYDLVGTAT